MNAERLSLEGLEDAALNRLLEGGIRLRLYLAPPVFLSTITLLTWDGAPWRRGTVFLIVSLAALRLGWEAVQSRSVAITRGRISSLLPVPAAVMTLVVVASGGVDSPLVVMMPLVAVFLSLFLSHRAGFLFAGFGSVVMLAVTLFQWAELNPEFIPLLFGGGARLSNSALLFSRGGAVLVALWWGAVVGWVMRRAFRSAIQAALDARDEVLHNQQESAKTLTTLAAEIAHELKNPLASVKGLAALVDREAQGKDKERLTVLRREVDRMQEILESFLTFSRPLVPLAVAPVSLSALVQSVIELHEGMAHERGIELRADAKDLSVTGDSRKLKQVLINLVQNALDVAPKGSSVDLVVRSEKAGGAVLVMDRGPGVADAERAFVPGVTSKEHGNGLGLTVSRLVARQHGGDVRLLPREGGGTIAELLLPGAPP
jgi:two-component system sensor histidine kinase HydH